ncbi:MAG: hypothetical protein COA62_10230 [Rhodobiaceae bacterium]|nr:MAG: hypothetical protein COA62_10230 [Rhodobiaceae bacterium]
MHLASSFATITTSLTDGVITINKGGTILSTNPAVRDIFGYSPEELIGNNISMLMPPAQADIHDALVTASKVSQAGRTLAPDRMLNGRRKDGSPIPVSIRVFGFRDENDQEIFLGLVHDQSHEKALEKEKNKNRLLYRNIDLLEGIGMWRIDVAANMVDWTEQIYTIQGLTKETFKPSIDNMIICYHPEDRPLVEKSVRSAMTTGEKFEFRARILRPDNTIRYVKATGRAVQDPFGKPISIFGTLIDMTDEYTREIDLARFSSQQLILKDILYQCSQLEDLEEFCTHSLKSLYGFPWSGATGSSALLLPNQWQGGYHCIAAVGLSPEEISDLVTTCLSDSTPDASDRFRLIPIKRKNVTFAYLAIEQTNRSALSRQEETFVSAVADVLAICFADISKQTTITEQNSELKTRIVKVQQLSTQFENQARAMTRLSSDLEHEKNRAEAASISKSAFLANMSHEVRTPLNGVLGMLSMLELSTLSDDDHDCVQMAKRAAYAALQLINDILDLSQLEAGKLSITPHEFSLDKFLNGIQALLAPKAHDKELEFNIQNELGDRLITGDDMRIQQVVINLIDNAIKFTQSGYVRMRISQDAETGQVCFVVEDSGDGMPPEKLSTIFDRFEQVDPSSTRRHGGVGLGLSICQNLVELMSGTIEVNSELGKGTRFSVHLPLSISSHTQPVAVEQAASGPDPCASLKILAAEDNDLNQEILCRIAKALDLDITIVENGEEALKAVLQGDFDVVLMDVQMPVMDGPTATRAIRAAGETIPILAVTAHAMAGDKERFLASGMDGYITKPYEIATLLAEIERVTMQDGQTSTDRQPVANSG